MDYSKLMFRPEFNPKVIKAEIEKENSKMEIVKVKHVDMTSWDAQRLMCLEWFNNHEYVLRLYYRFLIPLANREEPIRQRIGVGSGHYIQLFNKEEDFDQALKMLIEYYEEMKE